MRAENEYFSEEISQMKSILKDLKAEKIQIYEEKSKIIKELNEKIEALNNELEDKIRNYNRSLANVEDIKTQLNKNEAFINELKEKLIASE